MTRNHVTYIKGSTGTNKHQQLLNFNHIILWGLSLVGQSKVKPLLHVCFFFFTTAFIPALFKLLQTVWAERELLMMVWSVLAMSTAVSAFPEVIKWTAWQMLAGESFLGQPPVDFGRVGRYSEWSLEIVLMLIPVIEAMYGVEWPSSR